jgi:serine/threonine-protein kinase RsbW
MSDAIEIGPLCADDAERLSDCFRRCYGDSYVPAFFYDPTEIRSRLTDRRLESLVARRPDGEIVGHMALMRPHLDALTVELGSAIVDPRYRGHGLLARLGGALVELTRSRGAVGYHHYQTTAHAIIQRATEETGAVETGVMLAYIPAGTEYRDLLATAARGRLAAVTVYQSLGPAPHLEVMVPRRYRAMLREVYARAGLARNEGERDDREIPSSSVVMADFDPRRSLLRIDVEQVGADLCARVAELERAHPSDVTHVHLLLADRVVERGVEELRERGFFFSALLPEYSASDVLRLQRLRTEAWERPELVNPRARRILDAVLADR